MIITIAAYVFFMLGYIFSCFAWFFSKKYDAAPGGSFKKICSWGRNIVMLSGILSVLWFGTSFYGIISLAKAGVPFTEPVFLYTAVCAVIFCALEVLSWLAYRRYRRSIIVNTMLSSIGTDKNKSDKK